MIIFEVYLNGNRVCRAGANDLQMLLLRVMTLPREGDEIDLGVLGYSTPPDGKESENRPWSDHIPVNIGDEIRVKILDEDSPDWPYCPNRN